MHSNTNEDQPFNHFQAGDKAFLIGHFTDSIEHYNKAIQGNHDDIMAYLHKSNAYSAQDLKDKSLECCEQALSIDPNNPPAHYLKVVILIRLGRNEEAEAFYQNAPDIHPDDYIGHYYKGYALRELGKTEEAISYFKKAIDLNHGDSEYYNIFAYYSLGVVLERLSKENNEDTKYAEEVIELCKKTVEMYPDSAMLNNRAGIIYGNSGNWQKAASFYEKAVGIAPQNAAYNHNVGFVNFRLKNFEKAALFLEKAVEIKPQNAHYNRNSASANVELGNLKKAATFVEKAAEIEPENVEYNYQAGLINSRLGNFEKAATFYEKVAEIEPENAEYNNHAGVANSSLGNFKKAATFYEIAAEIEPQNAVYNYNAGRAYSWLKNFEKAATFYEIAAEIKPENAEYNNHAGVANSRLGNFKKAAHFYEKAAEIEPQNAVYNNNAGLANSSRGNWEKAAAFYEKAAEIEPENAVYNYNAGRVYSRLNNFKEAATFYEKAAGIEPENAEYNYNAGLANSRLGNFEKSSSFYEKAAELYPEDEKYTYCKWYINYKLGNWSKLELFIDAVKTQDYTDEPIDIDVLDLGEEAKNASCQSIIHTDLKKLKFYIFMSKAFLENACDGLSIKGNNKYYQSRLKDEIQTLKFNIAEAVVEYAERYGIGNGRILDGALQIYMSMNTEDSFNKILEINPEPEIYMHPQAKLSHKLYKLHYDRGNFLYHNKETEKALEHYQVSIKLNPGFPDAYIQAINCANDLNKTDEANDYHFKGSKILPSYIKSVIEVLRYIGFEVHNTNQDIDTIIVSYVTFEQAIEFDIEGIIEVCNEVATMGQVDIS